MLVDLVYMVKDNREPKYQAHCQDKIGKLPKDAFRRVTNDKESVAICKILESIIKKIYSSKIFNELYQIYSQLSEQFKTNQEKLAFKYITYEGVDIQDQPLVPKKIAGTA